MVSASRSITVMSCPSADKPSARELPILPAPAIIIFIDFSLSRIIYPVLLAFSINN
jgi:hypothetical protein